MKTAETGSIQRWSTLLARASDGRVSQLESENKALKHENSELRDLVRVLLDRNKQLNTERLPQRDETLVTRRPMTEEERRQQISGFFGKRS